MKIRGCENIKIKYKDKRKIRYEDKKMFYKPPVLDAPYAQILSEIKFYFLIIFKNNLNIFILFKLIPNILYKTKGSPLFCLQG